jgi:outer membrane protein assembly factor BamB
MRWPLLLCAASIFLTNCELSALAMPPADEARNLIANAGVAGGLIVHIGCGDGSLTNALLASDRFLVQGLDADPRNVQTARRHVRSAGVYGRVSIDHLRGPSLPYRDGLVNLIVVSTPSAVPMHEVTRVLVPGGVVMLQREQRWQKIVKPAAEDIDDWTHYLYDATGNPVSKDTRVAPPYGIQWEGGPRWSRSHERMSSLTAMVSANGRVFSIIDEGPAASIYLPPKWRLVARDAFNGVKLWERKIPEWHSHLFSLKRGPFQLPRRLVAVDDRVFVTRGLNAPLEMLDAATGETLKTYENTEHTDVVLHSNDHLVLLVGPSQEPELLAQFVHPGFQFSRQFTLRFGTERSVIVLKPETGEIRWKKTFPEIVTMTLAADGGRVFFLNDDSVVCLDMATGHELWQSECFPNVGEHTTNSPQLCVQDDVVLIGSTRSTLVALSADDGRQMWTQEFSRQLYCAPADITVIDDVVWDSRTGSFNSNRPDYSAQVRYVGYDLHSGERVKEIKVFDVRDEQDPGDWRTKVGGIGHHRCHRGKATQNYLLSSTVGIEYVDPRQGTYLEHHWVRGACLYGILPANGLTYATPHPCGCFMKAKLSGFVAMSPTSSRTDRSTDEETTRLETGPDFRKPLAAETNNVEEWPTYRHDASRSGASQQFVPATLAKKWATSLLSESEIDSQAKLSRLTVADGKVFVAKIDCHELHALDAETGEFLWQYTAGGRIDSPPTIYRDLAIFGCADGCVYCLSAANGTLRWRFRAAPAEVRMISYGQLESPWPVPGSVLVVGGTIYCAAGHTAYLDGGIDLHRLEPESGELLSTTNVYMRNPNTGKTLPRYHAQNMEGALQDILSSDGHRIYMRHKPFELDGTQSEQPPEKHVFSSVGFLDDTWWHRTYWAYGTEFLGGFGGWQSAGTRYASGKILCVQGDSVYGYGRAKPTSGPQMTKGNYYQLFAADSTQTKPREMLTKDATHPFYAWRRDMPFMVRAMVVTDGTLFIAGPRGNWQQSLEDFHGDNGVDFWAVSTHNGENLASMDLDSAPTFDGMAAAYGRIYLATTGGQVLCLAGDR